ncbi:hypothetical protein V5799_008998 [Amblyomma americanum]|uniref:Ionotropic glutamate receptor C-terminal domain-containing protein n=1 Tax=Amblyomma americanum TaxID=6943 RepID=A0AAQ4FBK9_AMBAM
MGMLVRNEADITAGALMVTTSRTEVGDPTFPISYIDVVIFAGRPFEFAQEAFGFLRAFSGCVWMATTLAFVATWSTYVGSSMASAVARQRHPDTGFSEHWSLWKHGNILESLEMLLSSFLSQGSSHLPKNTAQRSLVAVWFLSLIVLRTSFIGQTKASLVVRADFRTIEGIEDIARDDKITPIVVQGSGFLWLLETTKTDVFRKVLEKIRSRKAELKRHDLFSTATLKRILKGEAAMIFTQQPIAGEVNERCGKLGNMDGEFYYAPKLVAQLPVSMFMRKELDPKLRNRIDETIKLFIERGLVHKLFRDSGHEETPCRRESELSEQQRATTQSQMEGLQGIFLIWLVGLAAASLVLVAERLQHRWAATALGVNEGAATIPAARRGAGRVRRRRFAAITLLRRQTVQTEIPQQ